MTLDHNVEVSWLRKYAADTTGAITFSWIFGAVNELLICGLSVQQYYTSRLAMSGVHVILGRPFGLYRDYIRVKFKANESIWRKRAADIFSANTFATPFYATALYSSGTTLQEIIQATITANGIGLFIGRPYGAYLDIVRNVFRIPSEGK